MFERCLYFNVNALARAVNQLWQQAFAEFDLSAPHAYCLRLVLASPGIGPKQISEELQLEKSTVSRFLDALEQKRLITRKKGVSGDAREQGIHPTARAQKIAEALEQRGQELYEKMTGTLGRQGLASLVTQMRETAQRLR